MERVAVVAGPGSDEVLVTHRLTDPAAIEKHGGDLKNTQLRAVPGLAEKHAEVAKKRENVRAKHAAAVKDADAARDRELSVLDEEQKGVDAESFTEAERLIEEQRVAAAKAAQEEADRLKREADEARKRADANPVERTAP